MKKAFALVLALAMVFALAACGGGNGGNGGSDSGNTVKIGVFEPQSGDNGAGGKQEILGMQYANVMAPTVEIGGKTYQVELVYADNASSNDKAPTAAQTLISGGVSVVLGSYGSGVSIAAGDTFKAAGVPAIGVTCTNPQVTSGCDVYFRICFLDRKDNAPVLTLRKLIYRITRSPQFVCSDINLVVIPLIEGVHSDHAGIKILESVKPMCT